MGWEQRGGRSYYYRKGREGGQVCSKYVGIGILAQICAKNDQHERRDRREKLDAHDAMRQAESSKPKLTNP